MDKACTCLEGTVALTLILCCIGPFKGWWSMNRSLFRSCKWQKRVCFKNKRLTATFVCLTGVELQLRMAGDSRVLMDHNMEIGVTPAQVNCTATSGRPPHWSLELVEKAWDMRERMWGCGVWMVMENQWDSWGSTKRRRRYRDRG